jgi:hypothetical protein
MSEPKPDSVEIAQSLKSVLDYVYDCERRVHRGEIMDLQGLDNNVIKLCNSIAELPPKEARVLEVQMSALIEGLEKLAGSMKEQQTKMTATGAG